MHHRRFAQLIAFFSLTVAAAAPAWAAPVGMSVGLTGKPEFKPASGGGWRPLVLRQKLEPGDAVRCAAGAQATLVLFSNGERFQVAAGKEATVEVAAIKGAQSLGALKGPSARVAMALGGAPTGVVRARPAPSHRRLKAKGPTWLSDKADKLEWDPEPSAGSYLVSLFDQADNVVWSVNSAEPSAALPAAEGSPFGLRRPYVWRMTYFGRSGKPAGSRWGVITFLSAEQAAQLAKDEAELQAVVKAAPDDVASRLLLADFYQSFGVMERTLEVLDDLRTGGEAGIEEALEEAHRQISPLAHLLYTQSRSAP